MTAPCGSGCSPTACAAVLSGHADGVSAMGWHLTGGCLATGSEDGRVMLWDTSGSTCPPASSPAPPRRGAPPRNRDVAAASGEELVKDVVAAAAPAGTLVYSIDLKHANGEGAEVRPPSADGTALFCELDDAASRCSAMWMGRRRVMNMRGRCTFGLCACAVRWIYRSTSAPGHTEPYEATRPAPQLSFTVARNLATTEPLTAPRDVRPEHEAALAQGRLQQDVS